MASSSKDEWEKNTLAPSIGRFPPRQDQFVTDSGLEIDALYSPENLADAGPDLPHHLSDLAYPKSSTLDSITYISLIDIDVAR